MVVAGVVVIVALVIFAVDVIVVLFGMPVVAVINERVVLGLVAVHIDDIDPGEPVNINLFDAFECNQETPQSLWLKDCAL